LKSGRVHLEIPDRRRDRREIAIVEDHHRAGAHQLAQVEQVDEDVVKDVAAVHESRVGGEAVAWQTGQDEL